MSRLFTFGCSFTEYHWPTWANILGQEFDHFENWGLSGGGNQFIFNSINECLLRNKLNSDDTVVVMWSSIFREDRYLNNKWCLPGSLSRQIKYDKNFIVNFVDAKGCLIRDLACINAARLMLEHFNIKYYFVSMVPITNQDFLLWEADNETVIDEFSDRSILDLYKETLDSIRPSVYETVFKSDWYSRPLRNPDSAVKNFYNAIAGKDWPNWEKFLRKDFSEVDHQIVNEVLDEKKWGLNFKLRMGSRIDPHPVPAEHLEYIRLILPEFSISQQTEQWVIKYNKMVLDNDLPFKDTDKCVEFERNLPIRW
jgi:hypothetical protein